MVLALVEPATGQVDFPEAVEAIRGEGMFLANALDQLERLGVEVVGLGVPRLALPQLGEDRQIGGPIERRRPDAELMLGLLHVVGPPQALLGGSGAPACQLDVGQGDQDHGHTRSRRQTDLRLIPLDMSQRQPVSFGRLIVLAPRRQQESEALARTSLERAQPAGKTLLGVIRHLAETRLGRVVMSLRGQGRSDPLQVARADELVRASGPCQGYYSRYDQNIRC